MDTCDPLLSFLFPKPTMSSTLVFTIANQKGGVGKTTTAVNLAAALAEKKIHTLLIDLDPQANATSAIGVEKKEGRSLYGPLRGEGSALEMITPTPYEHLALIPTFHSHLADVEVGGLVRREQDVIVGRVLVLLEHARDDVPAKMVVAAGR